MASIEQIRASDGSGNANLATIQNSRSPGASTIIVDTVLGANPAGFAGTMGTPHTFTDPITSETITVISEDSAVDFFGHVDGSNFEIDDIAPGYADAGSEVGDVVIIRPTTQWGDNVADVLDAAHDDDGTLKDGAVDAAGVLASDVVTTAKILDENVTSRKLAPTIISKQASADVTSISTEVDITGCTTTFTPAIASSAIVYGIFYFNSGSAANDIFYGSLNVDGSNEAELVRYVVPTSGGGGTFAQIWVVSLSATSHTLKLRAGRTSGTGTAAVRQVHTKLLVSLVGDANVTDS